jgi:hypothetical protein
MEQKAGSLSKAFADPRFALCSLLHHRSGNVIIFALRMNDPGER